jgi:hypothetical protein
LSKPHRDGQTAMRSILIPLLGATLICGPAIASESIRFVVIGDTRPRFESENLRIFESLIARINERRPALAVNLGDLIYGYGTRSKEKQWDNYQQAIKAFAVPYHQLPGNHDIFSKKARQVYERRFGQLYQSFDHGEYHFVLLNNCEEGRWGEMGSNQLAWLKADLGAASARGVFVFMHFPVWEPERVTQGCYEFWQETLHPLFRASRVQAVFGGHYHSYGPTREFDGIRYFITGGGGAELRPEYRKAGGEHHFVEVRAEGTNTAVRVVTEHGELSDAEADVLGGFEFADRHSSRIGLDAGMTNLQAGVTGNLVLNNPYAAPLTGKAEWNLDPSVFQVEPRSVAINIPPGRSTNYTFTIRVLRDRVPLDALPWLAFNVAAGTWHHRFHRAVVLLRQLAAPYRPDFPVLDGQLTEWGDVPWLHLGDASKPPANLRALRTKDSVVLAVAVPTVSPEASEESGFPDTLQIGFAHRQSDTEFSGDFLRLGFAADGGATGVRDRTPSHRGSNVPAGIRHGWRQADGQTFFEIAIPTALLKVGTSRAERRLVLSLAFPLPDGGPTTNEPLEPKPNTFAYQARYGGNALVPVHIVELVLAPAAQAKQADRAKPR